MSKPQSLMDCKTLNQLAKCVRTVKTAGGFSFDVHEHGVFVSLEHAGGDSVWIPRRHFNRLVKWYIGPAKQRAI